MEGTKQPKVCLQVLKGNKRLDYSTRADGVPFQRNGPSGVASADSVLAGIWTLFAVMRGRAVGLESIWMELLVAQVYLRIYMPSLNMQRRICHATQ